MIIPRGGVRRAAGAGEKNAERRAPRRQPEGELPSSLSALVEWVFWTPELDAKAVKWDGIKSTPPKFTRF